MVATSGYHLCVDFLKPSIYGQFVVDTSWQYVKMIIISKQAVSWIQNLVSVIVLTVYFQHTTLKTKQDQVHSASGSASGSCLDSCSNMSQVCDQ